MNPLKDLFLLDPEVIFLNHGSFGACPRPVFEVYQEWQRKLERQPVEFLGRQFTGLHQAARQALAEYLHASPTDLVFIPNATYGVNAVARALALQPGDEILGSDHEYGACDYTWELLCRQQGAAYRRQPIPLPVASEEELFERLWGAVTPRTRLIFISHITSPTALRFPVKEICTRARERGILTLVDGAHAPGQIDLDLPDLGPDFYTGNCHKWMLAPKGSAFLFARPEVQDMLQPLVVSWGSRPGWEFSAGSAFLDRFEWAGTKDPAAALSVPAAIQFMADHRWEEVRCACHRLLRQAIDRICALVELEPLYPPGSDFYFQMGIAPLPAGADLAALKARLYDEYHVEVPLVQWGERKFVRISVQAYNTQEDIDALVEGLRSLLPQTVPHTPVMGDS